MNKQDKIDFVSNFYEKGKLEAMQLNDIDKPNIRYDIIIFMYVTNPDEHGFTQYIPLDYVYGATDFQNQCGFGEGNAILAHSERVYDALDKLNLLKGDK